MNNRKQQTIEVKAEYNSSMENNSGMDAAWKVFNAPVHLQLSIQIFSTREGNNSINQLSSIEQSTVRGGQLSQTFTYPGIRLVNSRQNGRAIFSGSISPTLYKHIPGTMGSTVN
jgi:hypothetical protein